jgi:hypothetical protein
VVTLGFIEVGTHLVVDGICGMRETAGDVELVRSFLEYFPERMGMTRVLGPYVFSHDKYGKEAHDFNRGRNCREYVIYTYGR